MLIECPFCHTRAKLPESKQGAKVRCTACSKVYRAREILARGSKPAGTGPLIVAGVVAVIGLGALMWIRGDGPEPAPVKAAPPKSRPEPASAVQADPMGWDSELVQLAVKVHGRARAKDRVALASMLREPQILSPDAPDGEAAVAWSELDEQGREARLDLALSSLVDLSFEGTVAGWAPYDGEVIERNDRTAVIQISASPIDGGSTKRIIEWRLIRAGDEWKVNSWENWQSERDKVRADRGYEVVKLSDGSVVVEREPEPLYHLEDTPPKLCNRIDELIDTMLDLDLTTEAARASNAIVEIGKPAIPLLLTHLYENKLRGKEDSIRANIAVQALRGITDQYFGYQPQALVGSAMGTTEERRLSAVRQWFAWWYRYGDQFTELQQQEEE